MNANGRSLAIAGCFMMYASLVVATARSEDCLIMETAKQTIAPLPGELRDKVTRLQELSEVARLADRNGLTKNAAAVRDEIRRLASEEAVSQLIEEIGYPDVSPPGVERRNARVGFSRFGPVAIRLPAVVALVEIGEPCVERVIEKMLVTKSEIEF